MVVGSRGMGEGTRSIAEESEKKQRLGSWTRKVGEESRANTVNGTAGRRCILGRFAPDVTKYNLLETNDDHNDNDKDDENQEG